MLNKVHFYIKMPVSQQIWIPLNQMPLNAYSNVIKHIIS